MPDSPFQARFTTCAATSAFAGRWAPSHHCPVSATMPTSICAYIGAVRGSRPRRENSSLSRCSTAVATSPISDANVPVAWATGESRTRMRNPSVEVST